MKSRLTDVSPEGTPENSPAFQRWVTIPVSLFSLSSSNEERAGVRSRFSVADRSSVTTGLFERQWLDSLKRVRCKVPHPWSRIPQQIQQRWHCGTRILSQIPERVHRGDPHVHIRMLHGLQQER